MKKDIFKDENGMENKYCEYQKILLNLKWFVKQFCIIFEEKLERRCSKKIVPYFPVNDTENDKINFDHLPSSVQSTPKHGSWTQSLTNSPLVKRLSALQKHSGSPIKMSNSLRSSSSDISRLTLLKDSTSKAEREKHLKRFGEHVCVVYEYQIGMLRNLQSISMVVVYVVDLLLKAIKKGVLLGLDSAQLNPTILFDISVMPKSGSKLVKTVGIRIHSSSLTWRVSNIFTHPGLRHNQVGGEDCSNLSIVTHLLTGFCPFSESRRPDIYGYRNLIVVPKRRFTKKFDTITIFNQMAYEISLYDSATISHAQTNSMDVVPTASINSLLDHIHKCYKSIFFVIFDRPAVIEHLMTCQSFRVFCTKELITPIMFLNSFNETTISSCHKSLFHNFDLFNICVTAKPEIKKNLPVSITLSDSQQNDDIDPDKSSLSIVEQTISKDILSETSNDDNLNKSDSPSTKSEGFFSREYDNFGFNI